jgi:hypothetical protein
MRSGYATAMSTLEVGAGCGRRAVLGAALLAPSDSPHDDIRGDRHVRLRSNLGTSCRSGKICDGEGVSRRLLALTDPRSGRGVYPRCATAGPEGSPPGEAGPERIVNTRPLRQRLPPSGSPSP